MLIKKFSNSLYRTPIVAPAPSPDLKVRAQPWKKECSDTPTCWKYPATTRTSLGLLARGTWLTHSSNCPNFCWNYLGIVTSLEGLQLKYAVVSLLVIPNHSLALEKAGRLAFIFMWFFFKGFWYTLSPFPPPPLIYFHSQFSSTDFSNLPSYCSQKKDTQFQDMSVPVLGISNIVSHAIGIFWLGEPNWRVISSAVPLHMHTVTVRHIHSLPHTFEQYSNL